MALGFGETLPRTNIRIESQHGANGWEAWAAYPMITLPNGQRVQQCAHVGGRVPGTEVSGFGMEESARWAAAATCKIRYKLDIDNKI